MPLLCHKCQHNLAIAKNEYEKKSVGFYSKVTSFYYLVKSQNAYNELMSIRHHMQEKFQQANAIREEILESLSGANITLKRMHALIDSYMEIDETKTLTHATDSQNSR